MLTLQVLNVSTVVPFSTFMVHKYARQDFYSLTVSHNAFCVFIFRDFKICIGEFPGVARASFFKGTGELHSVNNGG